MSVPYALIFSACDYCAGLVGVQISNVNESYEGRLPYVNMVLMLLVDAMLYFLLAWYLDQVRKVNISPPPKLQPYSRIVGFIRLDKKQSNSLSRRALR